MNSLKNSTKYNNLFSKIYDLYHLQENKSKLLFHGWHHIEFVHENAIEFTKELEADAILTSSAALVHDLNYIYTDKLEPEAASQNIADILSDSGFSNEDTGKILDIVRQAHTGYRENLKLSSEAKALSDADTLFKALPITPILFASKFIIQNKYNISKLANKIIKEQKPLIESDKYFYTKSAKKQYMKWAKTTLQMWENVEESINNKSVRKLLDNAKELGVL